MDKAVEALGLNLPQLIAQVVNFFVLLLILRLVAYKPILKMLDERKQKMEKKSRQLLVTEIQNLESLFQDTKKNASDRPKLASAPSRSPIFRSV